ncbi:PAS domain S-box-containing protein [Methylobacterium phyllostachyos]|uniref:Blue-light-activated histidine kinase n=1 Tax=Methylobacterium phyllostachyos TaxID=582672 RepID=A0A1G9U1F7_9HYPH|nr:GAF domain-containing protein [Methylobacterium phyllostachyos]SDM53880.1 PAS domain S-box-containing protein [Methylobacterium phyllostachyos]
MTHVPDRSRALDPYAVMDTQPERAFDDLARVAALLCATPTALVTLVDGTRQFFKAREGYDGGPDAPLDAGFCPIAVRTGAPLVIRDTLAEGHGDNVAVSEGGVRFYAGMPLRTAEGAVLGTLCVLDRRPRPDGLAAPQVEGLERLADQVVDQLEMRRALAERDGLLADRRTATRDRLALGRTQGNVAASGGDLDAILATLVDGAMRAVPAAEGGVMEMLDGQELEYRAVGGTLTPHRGTRVPLNGSTSGACARTGEPILLSDALTDPRVKVDLRPIIDLRSAVHAPVVRGGRILGVLKLQASRPDAFTEHDLDLVVAFAGLATMGLTEASEIAALRSLNAGAQRQRAIFDSTTQFAIVVTDRDGRVTDWNSGAERVLGWTADEMRGETVERIFTPEDRAEDRAGVEMRLSLEHGRASDERWHLKRDGARFWASGEMMPLRDADEGHIGFVKVLRDRTDEHLAGKALAEAEAGLHRAQEAGGVGLFAVEMSDNTLRPTPEFCRLYGLPIQDAYPSTAFEGLVVPEDAHLVSTATTRGSGDAPRDVEYRIRRPDTGMVRWIGRRGDLERDGDGRPVRFVGAARDITDRREAAAHQAALLALGDRLRDLPAVPEMTRAAAEIVGRALGVSRVSFGLIDATNGVLHVEPDWTMQGHTSIAGVHRFAEYGDILDGLLRGEPLIVPDVALDPRTAGALPRWGAIGVTALLDIPVRERGRTVAIYLVHHHEPRDWTEAEIAFVRAVADRVDVGVARVRAEERRALLNQELSHRLKNTLAMVQAIATQTMRGASDLDTAMEVLAARLIALGKAHDILMAGESERADMRAVIAQALAIHDDGRPGRFQLDGPAVVCGEKAALSLALMMHELATNATKYGALSTADGRIDIGWTVTPSAPGGDEVRLTWSERGGPSVTPPPRKGFGSRLIERGLAGAVGGSVRLHYHRDGLACEVVAPLAGFSPEAP